MITKTDFPRAVDEFENTWIPLAGGARLAARIWLPADAREHPAPAILEYLPYRKNDGTAPRDALTHPYFAGHGYASIRVDMRGSGDSDGILEDEYLPQEQDDALEVLAWIAAQPWCTGAVGMIGISWGGFNGLQIAARRPPELKAVITVCSTDDRYTDDCHYMGGCVVGSDMLGWASYMLADNALPPDPRFVGERWRQMWLDRIEHTPPFIEAWLSHQRRDAFWKHGSVREDYAAITCPVYAVGGWADPYTNAVPRLLAGLPGPRKGLIGPWAHLYPHFGVPGPAIGFLQECLRWWDYWLKGIDTGIMDEPMLRVWMPEQATPAAYHGERPGRWIAENGWPPAGGRAQVFALNDGSLDDTPGPERQLTFTGAQHAGLSAGAWCPHGAPGDMPGDQRAEDGLSLSFTSAPLPQRTEILGFPELTLRLAVNRPLALLALRLCAVAPDGASTLVTWGLLNLTHRDGDERPAELVPGQEYTLTACLNAVASALPPGYRWRLAVSPTYWPHAWPSPEPVTVTLATGTGSELRLPVRPPRPEDTQLAPFAPPESAAPLAVQWLRVGRRERHIQHDVVHGVHLLTDTFDSGRRQLADGLEWESGQSVTFTIADGDPLSARVRCEHRVELARGEWRTRVETVSTMWSDTTTFFVTNTLAAHEGQAQVFTKEWKYEVARDLV